VYCNKREEDAEGEREGTHFLCDGLGKGTNKKWAERGIASYIGRRSGWFLTAIEVQPFRKTLSPRDLM
jgi:hypothetical protein